VTVPTAALRALAHEMLERELNGAGGGVGDQAALVGAASRVTRRLGRPVGALVGVDAYYALLGRALHLARLEWPLLRELQLSLDAGGGVHGLDGPGGLIGVGAAGHAVGMGAMAALRPVPHGIDSTRDALAAILAYLLWLLADLIGNDLTQRAVHEVWPLPDGF
jgi:hypothetical protein